MLLDTILQKYAQIFDFFHDFWESEKTQKVVSSMLVIIFAVALALIEMNRHKLLPEPLESMLPTSSYLAINLAFSLVLILEVISLILTLPASMSRALGKQFEILALILLRNSFKSLSVLPEPISLDGQMDVLWHILAYGSGAIIIFGLLGIYLRVLRKLDETIKPGPSLNRFICAKKIVSLGMLLLFGMMGGWNIWLHISGGTGFHFFQYFYTLLIFSDVLMVLIAQAFLPQFQAIFRNSGYALCTLLIRLSLTAPIYIDVITAIFAIGLAIILTLIYNQFYIPKQDQGSGRQS